MEADRNPFPEIKILNPLERLKRIGSAVLDYMSFPCITEESTRPRGGAALLDEHLYGQMEFDYGTDEQTL